MDNIEDRSNRKLKEAHPDLQRLFNEVAKHFPCEVIEGHRDQENQEKAFASGKSKVKWPNSGHNKIPCTAVDVVPLPIDWSNREAFILFAGFVLGMAKSMGIKLRWGGDWNQNMKTKDEGFQDLPHFEIVE